MTRCTICGTSYHGNFHKCIPLSTPICNPIDIPKTPEQKNDLIYRYLISTCPWCRQGICTEHRTYVPQKEGPYSRVTKTYVKRLIELKNDLKDQIYDQEKREVEEIENHRIKFHSKLSNLIGFIEALEEMEKE